MITGALQDHMYRRSELKHKKLKPQISNTTNNVMKIHIDPNRIIFITFLHSLSLIIKTLPSSASKKILNP